MNTYYKATGLDGTDFKTGKVRYAVGKRVRPLAHGGEPVICGPGFLHAADVPAMTLVGGSWPCRLFEVAGKPAVGFDGRNPHKGGFRQLTVVCEIDAHLALGPNGQQVAALIDRVGKLTIQEVNALRGTWDAARGAAWDAAGVAARGAARDVARGAARDVAGVAAGVAAFVLVVRDLISDEDYNTLVAPWEQVMGMGYTR